MDDLKPCPFCGGEAQVDPMPSMLIYVVRCMCAECEIEGPSRNTEQTAIWAWNTRDERELTALKLAAYDLKSSVHDICNQNIRETLVAALEEKERADKAEAENLRLRQAATEQATQAEAVLEERTRERDEFERKGKELCVAYGTALITIHDLTRERDALALSQGRLLRMLRDWRMNLYPRDHAKYCRAFVKYPDWPDPKDDRCDLCKRTDAAIAEATPEGESKNDSSIQS